MVFDVYAGLSSEYREYRVIGPEQLNFRPAANDSERGTAAALSSTVSGDAKKLFIIGAVMVVLGILITIKTFGGIMLVLFGILPIVFGVLKSKQGNAAGLVATGILLKKESHSAGAVHSKTRRTFYWLVISVDGMEKTLCTVQADPSDFNEAREGDRILIIDNKATFRGKRLS